MCVFRAFPVCVLCSSVFSFLQSLPPPPFFRSNSFRCSNASSMLSLCASSVQLYPSFLSRYLLLFYSLCPSFFISPLCTPPDTCPIFSLCVFRSKLSFFLLFFTVLPISVLGLSVPLMRVFSLVAPVFPMPFPLSPPPFPPLSPSFPRFPSPFLRSFPLLRFPLRKKFPLKSCMISSVKYMFYSIFLVCLGKFF